MAANAGAEAAATGALAATGGFSLDGTGAADVGAGAVAGACAAGCCSLGGVSFLPQPAIANTAAAMASITSLEPRPFPMPSSTRCMFRLRSLTRYGRFTAALIVLMACRPDRSAASPASC